MPGYNFHAFLGFRTFPKLLFSNTIKLCPKPPVSVDPTGTMTRSPNRLHSLQTQAVSLKVPRPPAVLTNWPQICGFPWPFQVQQLAILKVRTSQTKRHKGQIWEGSRRRVSVPSPCGVRTRHPFHTLVCSPTGKLHWPQGQSFYWGFII